MMDTITSTLGHYHFLFKCVINRVWKCHITFHIHFICCLNILLLQVPLIYVVLNFACYKLNVDANACLDPYDELHCSICGLTFGLCFTFCSHCVFEFDTPELVRLCQSDWQPWAKKTQQQNSGRKKKKFCPCCSLLIGHCKGFEDSEEGNCSDVTKYSRVTQCWIGPRPPTPSTNCWLEGKEKWSSILIQFLFSLVWAAALCRAESSAKRLHFASALNRCQDWGFANL